MPAGADPNGPPGLYPLPPLFVAAGTTPHPAVISLLVAAGANVHARRWGGITPLHEAAGENTAGVVTALVEAGVDPNAQDRDGVAPLHLAAGHGSPAVVTALVAAGADLNVRGLSGKTPLGVAWPDGMNGYPSAYRVPVVRELLRLGADGFGGKDLSQITNPTYCGHWHTATFHRVAVPADFARCLEEGADVLARDRHGNTVLHGIASMDAAVTAVLLAAGAEVNARNSRGTTPLHNATESRNPATVSALLAAGAEVNARNSRGTTPLHNAVESRNPATVSALLEAGADINAADSDGDTPLMRASGLSYSAREAAELAQFFLTSVYPIAPTQYGESPIDAAAGSAEPEVIRLLAAAGAEVNRRHPADGAFPLHRAVLGEGAKSRVGALLEAGANPHVRDAEGNTPLHLAAPEDDTAVISLLVNAGADWSTRNDNGETPLEVPRHRASPPVAPELPEPGADPGSDSIAGIDDPPCEICRWIEKAPLESVRDCLDAGAPVNGPLRSDPTQLFYLADSGMRRERAAPEKIALLLAAGADPNPRNDEADTPLHAVVARGGARAEVAAAALIESGADVNARNSEGWTPLHNADAIPMVLLLLQAGADVNARTHLGETPLHLAVSWRQSRHTSADRAHVITALLEAGAEVDARTSDGWTPLQVALQADRAAEVVKLLEAGADPAARDGAGILADPAGCRHWGTATFFAVASVGVVASCLEAGADPNPAPRTEFYNWPLLHVASVHARDPAVIATLVQAGTDVHARDRFGSRPLHAAAEYGTPAAVRALLRAGADPHAHKRRFDRHFQSRGGQTPLHGAASNSDPEVAAVLLEAGADVSAPGNRGLTPLHSAARNQDPAVVTLLLEAGANVNARGLDGTTPLHFAAADNPNPAVLAVLLEAGADPNARARRRDCSHWHWFGSLTPLYEAARVNQHPEIVAVLVAAGADVNGRGARMHLSCASSPGTHVPPLYMAVRYDGHPAMIEALVRAGADLELTDPDGRTVLHLAAINRPHVFPLLMRLGADPEVRDAEGKTPMDYARENAALQSWKRVRMSTPLDKR